MTCGPGPSRSWTAPHRAAGVGPVRSVPRRTMRGAARAMRVTWLEVSLLELWLASACAAQPCTPRWASVGGGTNLRVTALALFDEDDRGPQMPVLIVGGGFTTAGGLPASRIARWDGSQWAPLGPGVDNDVQSLAVFDEDGDGPALPRLFAGGFFESAGGTPASHIARWDGARWSDVGGGVGGVGPIVSTMEVYDEDGSGPDPAALFAGGNFESAGGAPIFGIARWNGSAWSALGSGVEGISVSALEVFDPDGSGPRRPVLIVGGDLSRAGGNPIRHIAQWDGSTWAALGTGTNQQVYALGVFDLDGPGPRPPALIVSGAFSEAGGIPVEGLAVWDGQTWSAFPGGGTPQPGILSLTSFDPDGTGPLPELLIASGIFTTIGGRVVNYIARWDGSAWSDLNGGADRLVARVLGVSGGFRGGPPTLFAGGQFSMIGGIPASRVAAWVGCTPCPGDVNGDRRVDQQDLGILLANWLRSVPPGTMGDLTGDGFVDQQDLGILLANWMNTCL